ncbi:protein of unknown function (plasmid) [Azospirillum baldaniorum]|uniref:Uncharacterized protein n=1 Tax=Azospirillum baldaniorum TaxID=1064539 RepID=A0A9P1JY52_9PROT|nr:protein of unknown function [Azospirillum baldaniorum]
MPVLTLWRPQVLIDNSRVEPQVTTI